VAIAPANALRWNWGAFETISFFSKGGERIIKRCAGQPSRSPGAPPPSVVKYGCESDSQRRERDRSTLACQCVIYLRTEMVC
jgi:hypothetical protein